MRKKIFSLILGAILSFSVLAGCSLIEHNDEKDMQQVVAVIDSIKDTDSISKITYKSSAVNIYKSELVSAVNTYGGSYIQNGLTAEAATDRLLDELVTRELLIVEAERLLRQEKIEWTKADDNAYKKYVYSAIDNQLNSIRNNVLTDFGETVGSDSEEEEKKETTYPVPDTETGDEDYSDYDFDANGNIQYVPKLKYRWDENCNIILDKDGNPATAEVTEEVKDGNGEAILVPKLDENGNEVKDEEGNTVMVPMTRVAETPKLKVWEPEKYDWPAMYGTEKEKSRDRETVRRFISYIKDLVNADFRVTDADKAEFEKDDKEINKVINEQGIEYVYPMLWKTHYMEYLAGVSAYESILINKLQDFIVGSVKVTDEEIVNAYNSELTTQKETYENDQSAYQSAISGGSVTVLYLRDDSYFFVKHILLPFSDAQKAAFEAYKADPKNAGKDFDVYRDNMVNAIVAYPHKDGEDDLNRPMSVNQIFNAVKSEMSSLKVSAREAERKFDELIYLYSTDPGSFGAGKAYAVKRDDEKEFSGYMEEFYRGAMELYNQGYKEGEVLPHYVVTDYGVHIMYLAQKIERGIRYLNDYLTPGEYRTVRDTFEETIRTSKENKEFTSWQNDRINYYRERANVVHTYKDRYKSIYEE